ncbi:MAG TPA: CehA/McbA family metallohydrolase, partial [Pseudonocardia sp.]|nr:CehA/McbA family metallohydrolase [Pseudonocardia sp.]
GEARLTVADAVAAHATATLELSSPDGARWSVTDPTGGAWFAAGVSHKWDAADQPFFHTTPGTTRLAVPAGPLTVVAARGLEFERMQVTVDPQPGGTATVDYRPGRRFHPAADGWYGADLHVHLNYSGDHVLHPVDAARMQRGEGLHLMNLAAGNLGGPLVYDAELLESTAGTDLWAEQRGDEPSVARAGLEFRNDLLGHVHGLGLTAAPALRHTGHEGTDHPWDWPPNSVACAQMRELGAATTYAHPVFSPLDRTADLLAPHRTVEARELVADAALGVVDAVELVSCFDDRGALVLYHHLLSCGLRLAAVAGTDTFLSFAHGPAPASNPPGWGRVYAQLGAAGLSVEAFTAAIRGGRTLVTNGPWPALDVDGRGPGAVLRPEPGDRLVVRGRVTGSGVRRLVLYGPDGELAGTERDELEHEVSVGSEGAWLALAAHGDEDPYTVGAPVFAHTSPVYVDVAGRRVARARSARWCLALLDGLAELVGEHGRFDPQRRDQQLGDLLAVLDRARAVYREVERVAPAGT